MHRPVLAAVVLTLAVRAGAQLGDARRVAPVHFDTLPYSSIGAQVLDGNHFLFTLTGGTKEAVYTKALVLVDSDGMQVGDPAIVPVDALPIGMTRDVYIFRMGESFLRLSAKGELLDDAPRPLPVRPEGSAAGSHRFLVIGKGQGYLVDPEGGVTPAGAVSGTIISVAAKGDRFAVVTSSRSELKLRMLDGQGTTLRDSAMPVGARRIFSDGSTWLLEPSSSTGSYKVVNDDLATIRSFGTTVTLEPNVGRGYLGVRARYQSFPNPPPPAVAADVSGPQYQGNWATVPDRNLQGASLHGTARKLLLMEYVQGVRNAYLLDSVGDANRPMPAPLTFAGARDREAAVSATNAAGVTLVVWNEPTPSGAAIYAARLSAAGTMLDASPVPIGEDCRFARSAVATDGTDFLVVSSGCGQVNGNLFSATGGRTPSFSVLKQRSNYSEDPSATFDGESYLIAWPDLAATFLTRVGRDGTAVVPAETKLNGDFSVRLAPLDGGGALMVYTDNRLSRLQSRRITREARLADDDVAPIRAGGRADSLTRHGDHYLLTAHTSEETFLSRLDATGRLSLKQGTTVPIAHTRARVFCDAECTLVWREDSAPIRIVAAPLRVTASNLIELGEPVTVGPPGAIFRIGDPVLLRGPAADPRLLLYFAPDADSGSVQLFARSAGAKRRPSRP